jgi:small Trp-rich protein
MALLIIAIILGGLKLAEVGPFGPMSWWWPGAFLAGAATWWAIADATGMTQRRAMNQMDEKKLKRRERDMEALGLNTRREKRLQSIREGRRRAMSSEERESVSPDVHETGRKK